MELVLIRHGATEWNAARRFQGLTDVPLSPQGRAHAARVAAALRDERIERVYASDLGRALETARVVAGGTIPVVTDRRLREFDFGSWEGLTWEEILAASPELAADGMTSADRYRPADGESFAAVCERVESFVADLPRLQGVVPIVTHAGTLHAFFAVLGLRESASSKQRLRFSAGSITRVAIEKGAARLLTLNDAAHLDLPH